MRPVVGLCGAGGGRPTPHWHGYRNEHANPGMGLGIGACAAAAGEVCPWVGFQVRRWAWGRVRVGRAHPHAVPIGTLPPYIHIRVGY